MAFLWVLLGAVIWMAVCLVSWLVLDDDNICPLISIGIFAIIVRLLRHLVALVRMVYHHNYRICILASDDEDCSWHMEQKHFHKIHKNLLPMLRSRKDYDTNFVVIVPGITYRTWLRTVRHPVLFNKNNVKEYDASIARYLKEETR